MVIETREDKIRGEMLRENIQENLRLIHEIHGRYAPLVGAVEEALKEANPNNEPWKCPKFKALAEELEKIKPKEIEDE